MRIAHFDCFSGISGDMALGAILDAGVPAEPVLAALDSLQLPIKISIAKIRKNGFAATQVTVEAPVEDDHRYLADVEGLLAKAQLTPPQRELAGRIFRRIAEAEAKAHGMPLQRVHFHEVGALDSLADIVGVAVGLDLLGVERFTSSSVPTGNGTVQCAHGIMPIPAPGTAELLRGVPLRPTSLQGELTTPTGAAILTAVISEFVEVPAMTIEAIGHGAGQRHYVDHPNMLRLFVGTTNASNALGGERDEVWELQTNLDDVTGEMVGHCFDLLFAAGAVDVFTVPIQMKKNRPGILLSVLTPDSALTSCESILFRETRTFGIRRRLMQRHKLRREETTLQTPWGPVRAKRGWLEGHSPIVTPEYEDCARIARTHGMALAEVYRACAQTHSS